VGEALNRFDLGARRVGIVLARGALEKRGEVGAALVRHMDEAPGSELAVIGHAHRHFEHRPELLCVRPRRDHVARAPGSAGAQQSKRGGAIVQHLRGAVALPRKCNNPAWQARFPR
jgi:hypothetical protein